jgi:CBS domain-containing protein
MTTCAPGTTVNHNDHVAAAAYLMKRVGVSVLSVIDGQWSGRVIGIITEDDIIEAAAAGQNLNDVRVRDLMTNR